MYYNRYLQWIVIMCITSCHCSAVFPTFTGDSTWCNGKKSSSDICVNLTDHFLYHPTCEESDTFKLKYIPKSPRNRLMYYIYTDPLYAHSMKRLIHQLLKLDKEDTPFPNSPDNNSHFSHDCPPKKRRKYSTQILKVTLQMLCDNMNVSLGETVLTPTQVFTINSKNN